VSTDPAVTEAFDSHQRRAIAAMGRVLAGVQVGLSEVDIDELCREACKTEGFTDWFHPPEVQVGDRTAENAIWVRASDSVRLKAGDVVTIDIGPATGDAYGDIGTTVVLGDAGAAMPEPKILGVARECLRGCIAFTSPMKTVGEIFVYARAWAANHAVTLASERSIGHALLPSEGLVSMNFPRFAHGFTWLRRHQVHFLNPQRIRGMWAYRPLLAKGGVGASFEEAVVIDDDGRRILGRDHLDEVGTFPEP